MTGLRLTAMRPSKETQRNCTRCLPSAYLAGSAPADCRSKLLIRLVGGAGIEPATPSMSMMFLGFDLVCAALPTLQLSPIIQVFFIDACCRPLRRLASICLLSAC